MSCTRVIDFWHEGKNLQWYSMTRRRVLHIVRDGVFFFKANAISPSFRRSSLSKPNPLRWASVWGLATSFFIKNSSFAHSAAHCFCRTNAALVCTAIKALCGAAVFLIAPTKAQRSGLCEERTSSAVGQGLCPCRLVNGGPPHGASPTGQARRMACWALK